jgi:WS/DGAT/MGAT family acyltransferase
MTAADQGLAWGLEREMNALDAVMWRAEADARLRSTIVALELLEETPEWDRYLAAHEWATRMVPRFRQHVIEPVFGFGQPTWVVDPNFDLKYHVRRQRLVEPSWACLLDAMETLAMTPFDRARPPWETVLFEGLPDGRAGYGLKLHHSTTDGLGAIELLRGLHSRSPDPDPNKPQPNPPDPETPSGSRELVRQATRDLRAGARRLTRLAGAVGALRRPEQALRDALEFAASVRRVQGDPPAPPSPILHRRSMSWRFIALDVRFEDLRGASKPYGCSLNDAFIAALLGAFRRYHDAQGCPVDAIPMAMPISVRKPGDASGGNRIAAARLAGPVGIADPLRRMREVSALVASARSEPAMAALNAAAPLLAWLPGQVIAQLSGSVTKGNDLQASNVPGIREDVYFAGVRIIRSYPFGPLPGCAAMIALVSHGPYCCIGANVDAAAFADVEGFAQCLVEGFDEVLALHPGSAPAVRLG